MSTCVPFQYEALASLSTIRLIKLEKKKVGNELACTIRQIHQSEAACQYDALSYVWGSSEKSHKIRIRAHEINEQLPGGELEWTTFALHRNLWEFLNNLWERGVFDRWLWTDAICLDQSHGSKEKGEQIPRMGKIYSDSACVIAWLGMTEEQGDLLRPIRELIQSNIRVIFGFEEVNEHFIQQNFAAGTVAAAAAVRNAPYWDRIWIVQEVVTAREVQVVVGKWVVNFDILLGMVGVKREWRRARKGRVHHADTWRHLRHNNVRLTLWSLIKLVTMENYQSTERHDLVYGILGLASNWRADNVESPTRFIRHPDYDEPAAYVTMDALLESRPEWDGSLNYVAANLILRREAEAVNMPLVTMLESYVNHPRTSQRHKQLATLMLRVCDALFSITIPGSFLTGGFLHPIDFHRALIPFLGSQPYYHRRTVFTGTRTLPHDAAVLAMALVLGIYDEDKRQRVFEDWKSRRGFSAKRAWRCLTHLHSRDLQDTVSTDQIDESILYQQPRDQRAAPDRLIRYAWAPISMQCVDWTPKNSCPVYGSKMVGGSNCCWQGGAGIAFDIPEAGFRVELRREPARINWRMVDEHMRVELSPPEMEIDDLAG